MKINNEYLQECGFECDVEMNLSVHYWKDDLFELIDFQDTDVERTYDWDLIIFSPDTNSRYGNLLLIAAVEDIETVKQLLEIYNINPNNYFK